MKLAYLGTPAMAVPPLDALVAAGHEIRTVVTRADARRGRGGRTSPSAVKAAAERHGIDVTHDVDDVVPLAERGDVELGVVVAYGRIVRPHVLAALAMVNLHFSLLPRWRGAAPVERALLAGDEITGVCLMALEEGLDTGGVYGRVDVPVGRSTADELRGALVGAGSELLVDRLHDGFATLGVAEPQRGPVTHAAKITPAELRIDWSRPAVEIDRLVRLGGAWTTFRGQRVKILAAMLEGQGVAPTEVQPAGKPAMSFEAWRNGVRPVPGEWFE
ncbi:MAG: methionyl-tRNA formyltransferase [Ilumatobacteraceae bacterium]